jgi:hypothetical protein
MKKVISKKARIRKEEVTLATLNAKVDSRFTQLDSRFTQLDANVDSRFRQLDAKLDRIIDVVAAQPTRVEFEELKRESTETRDMVRSLVTSVDTLAKSVNDILLEYRLIQQQMRRYDRWFKEIADKLGIELKP